MKRYLLTLALGLLLGAVLLLGVLVARAFGFASRRVPALRIPTVSFSDTAASRHDLPSGRNTPGPLDRER